MHILCPTGSLYCGILRVFSYLNTQLSLHCGYMQLCDMSASNPLVSRIHNGTTCVNMVILFAEWMHACLKGIVDVKHLFDKNLASFIRRVIPTSYSTSFVKFC